MKALPESQNINHMTEEKKVQYALTEDQELVIEYMKEGWKLFQDRLTFNWYMSNEHHLFTLLKGNLNKVTVRVLLEKGIVKRTIQKYSHQDFQYILKEILQ